jgi:hypothetical protein
MTQAEIAEFMQDPDNQAKVKVHDVNRCYSVEGRAIFEVDRLCGGFVLLSCVHLFLQCLLCAVVITSPDNHCVSCLIIHAVRVRRCSKRLTPSCPRSLNTWLSSSASR